MREQPLPTNASTGVVRIGDTVRRPAGPWTDSVDELLLHLERVGFDGAPRTYGRDDQGRQVLEFIDGDVGSDSSEYAPRELRAIGRLLREYHDAVAGFVPSPIARWNQVMPSDGTDLVCHGDPAPWNIVDTGRRVVLIDWDFAGPGTRLWELAYAVQTAAVPRVPVDLDGAARRLRTVVDAYGLDEDERARLVPLLPRRTAAMVGLLRRGHEQNVQPWARIWHEDGEHWAAMTEFLHRNEQRWCAALA